MSSERNILFLGEHPLRLPEHLGVVDVRPANRRRVLLEKPLDLFVESPLAIPVLVERGLERMPHVGGGGGLHQTLGDEATRDKGRLRQETSIRKGHGL